MEIAMLILAAIAAIGAIITALPVLGVDLRIWGKEMRETDTQSLPSRGMSKWKYRLLLGISCLALMFSIVGIIMHELTPHRFTGSDWEVNLKNLEPVRFKSFENEAIVLDGKQIEDCKFTNVTFIFKGEKPFMFGHNDVNAGGGPLRIRVGNGPQFTSAALLDGLMHDACKGPGMVCPKMELDIADNK
jgi:hypothetical protein